MTGEFGLQWLWLNVGILLLTGILQLNGMTFPRRTGLALVVVALFLVVLWILVARLLERSVLTGF